MKKIKEGSYTVECALIMPIVLLVIVSLVWLLIYMYDKAAFEKNLIHALMVADYDYSASNTNLKDKIEERINESLADEIIGMKEVKVNVKVDKFSCSAEAEGVLNIPEGIPGLSKFCKLDIKISKKRTSGAETIKEARRFRKIKDALSEETEEIVESGNQNGIEPAIPDNDGGLLGLPDSNVD